MMRTTLNLGMSSAMRFGLGGRLTQRADEILRRWTTIDPTRPANAQTEVCPEVRQGLLTPDGDLFDTVMTRLYRRQDDGARAWHRVLPDVMTRVRRALDDAVGCGEAARRVFMVQSFAQPQQ